LIDSFVVGGLKMILSLKKVAALSIVVLLSSVAVVWGLKTLTAKEIIGPVEAETTYGPIKLAVRLDKNTFRLGENVNVTVTITNISNETIVLTYTVPRTTFAVYNSSLDMIYTYATAYGWAAVVENLVLEPSESSSQIWKWDQRKGIGWANLQPIDAGIYSITGVTGLYSITGLTSPPYHVVETPKVKIEIIP
jgi:hypothetical protein